MLKIPREKALERWDELPESLREAIFSEENSDVVINLAARYGFTEQQSQVLLILVGDVLRGFARSGDLPKEIITDLKVDLGAATEIYNEIALQIFQPRKDDIERVYRPLTAGDLQGTPPTKASSEKLKPSFAPDSPFIIHTEEEIKTAASQTSRRDLFRPSFYQPGGMAEAESSEPVTARIETEGLSRDSGKLGNPLTARTATPEPRVVHYSDLKTPLDPFGKAVAEPVKEEKKQEVHPENVINLKDLPK